jgi:hypothetical protein
MSSIKVTVFQKVKFAVKEAARRLKKSRNADRMQSISL